jgi:hypothetical protein
VCLHGVYVFMCVCVCVRARARVCLCMRVSVCVRVCDCGWVGACVCFTCKYSCKYSCSHVQNETYINAYNETMCDCGHGIFQVIYIYIVANSLTVNFVIHVRFGCAQAVPCSLGCKLVF